MSQLVSRGLDLQRSNWSPSWPMSNCWFSVCLRIFCLVVLIFLPKVLEVGTWKRASQKHSKLHKATADPIFGVICLWLWWFLWCPPSQFKCWSLETLNTTGCVEADQQLWSPCWCWFSQVLKFWRELNRLHRALRVCRQIDNTGHQVRLLFCCEIGVGAGGHPSYAECCALCPVLPCGADRSFAASPQADRHIDAPWAQVFQHAPQLQKECWEPLQEGQRGEV